MVMLKKLKKKNKKGQITILMILLVLGLFLALILLFVVGVATVKINEALNLNVSIGQVNFAEESAKTWGKFNEMVVTSADWWGVSLIFGMVLGLFASAFFLRGSFPKWALILDIFIILAIFIVSLYFSSSYVLLLNELGDAGETFLEDHVTKTSMFMANLPVFVVIIGVVMMILFHGSIPRRTEERIQQGGFLQGVQ